MGNERWIFFSFCVGGERALRETVLLTIPDERRDFGEEWFTFAQKYDIIIKNY